MSEHVSTPAADPLAPSWRRVFYWSLRRELWEHRAIFIAPLIVAAFALLGSVLSTAMLPSSLRALAAGTAKHPSALMGPYSFIAGSVMVTSFIISLFYATTALYSERRDRSLLFWKSLPVSDRTTVLAKAAIPIAVIPAVTFGVVFVTQLAMLVWSTLVTLINGIDPTVLWSHVNVGTMWVVLLYGLFVNALWSAPIYAWLLVVSAWARRVPFLWAVAPIVLPAMVEAMVREAGFESTHFGAFIGKRLFGGSAEAFSVDGRGKAAIHTISQIDPLRTFSSPDLWGGVIAATLLLAAAIWLRRRRETL
jgi:ABC-2 type transport system permease protein